MPPVIDIVEINVPPHEAFTYVADLRHVPDWHPSVREVMVNPAGSTHVGTVLVEKDRVDGAVHSFVVTDCTPDERIAMYGVDGPVLESAVVTFEPILDGRSTRVWYELDFRSSPLRRLQAARARRHAESRIGEELATLKRRLEDEHPTAAPSGAASG